MWFNVKEHSILLEINRLMFIHISAVTFYNYSYFNYVLTEYNSKLYGDINIYNAYINEAICCYNKDITNYEK